MKRHACHQGLVLLLAVGVAGAGGAANRSSLTIEQIMRGPEFVGRLPGVAFWSEDGSTLYFDWNPNDADGDSLYKVSLGGGAPEQVSLSERRAMPSHDGVYNERRTEKLYERHGDVFLLDLKSEYTLQITNTLERETGASFSADEHSVIFHKKGNLYSWDRGSGATVQLTDFRPGSEPKDDGEPDNARDKRLMREEARLMKTLARNLGKEERAEIGRDSLQPKRPQVIYTGKKSARNAQLSPDGRFVSFLLTDTPEGGRRTIVPNYVTESGYTEDLQSRENVGSEQATQQLGVYDRERDSVYYVSTDSLPGITDRPLFYQEYYSADTAIDADSMSDSVSDKISDSSFDDKAPRDVMLSELSWSPDRARAVIQVYSLDRKDRWIADVDLKNGALTALERQHDDAWIGGPGVRGWFGSGGKLGWLDSRRIWFKSEESGYSHIYMVDVISGEKAPITNGAFEVDRAVLSHDRKTFYFIANIEHPGDWRVYRVSSDGGEITPLTERPGYARFTLSPDESHLALRYSNSVTPWELYVQENRPGAEMRRLTHSAREEFTAYNWRDPEVVTFPSRDGETLYARLYTPDSAAANGAAVIFVHGAGYLQNAHKWWSSYYREYMFHNFLADNGYTVLDIDYRGSRGYGRDWRTGVYRHMGGKDLTDELDGAKYLVSVRAIDSARIGIYGGSYGGFMTLMAMFRAPGVFAAGAALRSVTDWGHYNHWYTQDRLNNPQDDSIAYERSSPVYFAEGLEGALLMCHGMIDRNVHFQDVVRLSQRLIELGKDDWELAVYPLEGHGFTSTESWVDEYKRIYRLFEERLR